MKNGRTKKRDVLYSETVPYTPWVPIMIYCSIAGSTVAFTLFLAFGHYVSSLLFGIVTVFLVLLWVNFIHLEFLVTAGEVEFGFGVLVPRSINTLAFERRCIHSGCVPLPRSTKEVRLGRAPCRSGASTLSVLNRIYRTKYLKKRFPRSALLSCEPYELRFKNYLGYGIRLGFDGTIAYNTRNGRGIKMVVEGFKRPYVIPVDDPPQVCALLSGGGPSDQSRGEIS